MVSLAEYFGLLVVGWISYQWYCFRANLRKVSHIPTIGSDSFLGSYLSAWRLILSGHKILEEGYRKYPGAVFKVATFETPTGWLILVSGAKLTDDVRKADDHQLAGGLPFTEALQMDYTFGTERPHNTVHHMLTYSGPMNKNIGVRFGEIREEAMVAFLECIEASDDWVEYPLFKTILPIVNRITNRFFIGLPFCRDGEFNSIFEKFAIRFIMSVYAVTLVPSFLRRLVGPLTTNAHSTQARLKYFLEPMVEERLQNYEEHGKEWLDKPNDIVTWLLDLAPEEFRTTDDVVARLLLSNFAAIHTTSTALTDILFNLAANREFIDPLRKEIEDVTDVFGWSKEAMSRLQKLDSFMKEVNRINGVGIVTTLRKAAKDFIFSNGTTVPKGFTVGIALYPLHHDPSLYEDPDFFDGYRFLPKRSLRETGDGQDIGGSSEPQGKFQMVSLDPSGNYLLFGVGRHACTGRFLAVNELKVVTAISS